MNACRLEKRSDERDDVGMKEKKKWYQGEVRHRGRRGRETNDRNTI